MGLWMELIHTRYIQRKEVPDQATISSFSALDNDDVITYVKFYQSWPAEQEKTEADALVKLWDTDSQHGMFPQRKYQSA